MIFTLINTLVAGLIILLVASYLAVGHAVHLSKRLKLSPLIIGSTIVAVGTSLPELFVSLVAQIEGSPGLSFGNIVGSNIANFGLVLSTAIILNPLYIGSTKTQRSNIVAFFITTLFAALIFKGEFTVPIAVVFVLSTIVYLLWQIAQGEEARNHEDRKLFDHLAEGQSKEKWWLTTIRLFITLSAVVFGSRLIVDSALGLAPLLGRKAAFFGLTVIAFGTSLPELATTVASSLRGESKLAAGNLIGSNILNILLIGGASGVLGANRFTNLNALIFFVGISFYVFILLLVHGGKKIRRLWGGVLLFLYLAYIAFALL